MSTSPRERLNGLVGFDPTKREGASKEVINKVLEKVKLERQAQAEVEAEKLIREAFDIAEQMKKLDKEYRNATEKHEKALGKLVSRVEAGLQGREAPAEQPEGSSQAPAPETPK